MTLEARWIDDPAEWARSRAGWDDLAAGLAEPSIFTTWDFLECCWLTFARPSGNRLAVVALAEAGRPVGFAPLRVSVQRRFGLPVRRLGALAAWESDRVPLLFPAGRERECASALAGALEARRAEWDYLELGGLTKDGPVLAALREWAASRRGLLAREDETSPSPYADLSGGGGQVLDRLGPRMRESVRRKRRKLEKHGPCRLETHEGPDEILPAFETYLELEARSWKPDSGQGAGKHERNRAFFRELLPRLARVGRTAICFLKQAETTLAGEISFRMGGVAWGSQWVYDQRFAPFSPGNLLRSMCLEWHAARGVRRFEMYSRFLDNKRHWADSAHHNVELRVLQLGGPRRLMVFAPALMKGMLKNR